MQKSSYEHILYEQDGPVTTITFNRPAKMNCVNPEMHHELIDAWKTFKEDGDALVAILTGSGEKAFCAGADLTAVFRESNDGHLDLSEADLAAHARGERPGFLGPSRWTDIYKPIIAAVNGVAYAGGLEWACFADIRLAATHATFGVTCRRWNVGLADGGTQRLPRIIGMGRAMDLIITGRVIDSQEAFQMGLVNEIVQDQPVLERARELARFIAGLPQPAIRTDKEAAVRGFGMPIDEGLRVEAECFNQLVTTPEIREGLRQFVERDHPDRRSDTPPVTPGLKQ